MQELINEVELLFPNRNSLLFNNAGRYNSVFVRSRTGPPEKVVQRKLQAKGFDVKVAKDHNKYGIHQFDNRTPYDNS